MHVLEVNSFCSFGPLSLVPKLATTLGLTPEHLYVAMVENAASRQKSKETTLSSLPLGG